jgi:hypothetical protein
MNRHVLVKSHNYISFVKKLFFNIFYTFIVTVHKVVLIVSLKKRSITKIIFFLQYIGFPLCMCWSINLLKAARFKAGTREVYFILS